MRDIIAIGSMLVLLGCIYFIAGTTTDQVVRYDCSISEISPDYPVEVKEACRRLRAEHVK